MSDKVRIHDLAKKYGMPGKDLAAKLRDFGFSQAKSHMSALDTFELLQAEGLLEANGITPAQSAGEPADDGSLGGLKIKRKKKKVARDPDEEPAAPAAEAPKPGAPEPEPSAVEATAPEKVAAEPASAPVEAQDVSGSTSEPASPPEVDADAGVGTGTTASAPAEPAVGAPPSETTSDGVAEPAAAGQTQPDAPAPAAAQSETGAVGEAAAEGTAPPPAEVAASAQPETPKAETPKAEAPKAEAPEAEAPQAAAPQPAVGEAGGTVSGGTETGKAEGEAKPADEPAAAEGDAEDDDKKVAGRRGTVVGFIDLTNVQRSEPRRKATESRRIQSRDDATPDVRPTYGRGRAAGPRGGLTAAELRQREQGRFLRRGGRPVPGGQGGGRRGGGGGRGRDQVIDSPLAGTKVPVEAPVTITKLAEALKLKANVVIKKALEEKLGLFNLNSLLDDDTASLIADQFDVELDVRQEVTAEQAHLEEIKKKRSEVEEEHLVQRPPTVAFLGHVDHGKTTLIDKIRETAVAEGESGGITQHIGAYQVSTGKGNLVTIVDTPGHEAFTSMRARGAKAVDIVVLVVAGDDGVKPSTIEAINHARAAKTPIVVALNKKDRPEFNANAVIQQLMGHELVPEQYGGTTAMFETSGISGDGIQDLLEHIFLMGEAELELSAHPDGPASGVVLEAEIQTGRGIVAHLLIQDGTLNKGDVILAGEGYGKVKSIRDDRGREIGDAGPSSPVEVTGLAALPGVGDPFFVVEALATAKEIATERERTNRAVALAGSRDASRELDAILGSKPKTEIKTINLIVRADVQGSAEVIGHEIEKLQHDEVEVKLVHSGVGPITESDVALAATSEALLVAFHVGVNGKARQEADRHGLDIRRYEVIYEFLQDLRDLMEGSLSPEFKEEIQGHTEIRALFKSSKIGLIAGCYVLDGKVTRNSKIRLLRDSTVVHTGEIGSLRREKEDVREVREGFECGIVLKDFRDIREGDVIESYRLKEVKRTL